MVKLPCNKLHDVRINFRRRIFTYVRKVQSDIIDNLFDRHRKMKGKIKKYKK